MPGATLILNPDGTAADASPAALELLGVTLEHLRQLPPGAFSPKPQDPHEGAAFREAWEHEGRPDIGGEATLQRLDGTQVRVRFAITTAPDGRFLAALEPTVGRLDAAPTLFTAGEVLAAWRAAERQLSEVTAGSSEEAKLRADIEAFRARYQELFAGRR